MNIGKVVPIVLLAFLATSAVFAATARADGCTLNLPSVPVTMSVVDGIDSYFITTLSNVPAGYDVTNGVYPGWCIDIYHYLIRNNLHTVILYPSCSPPSDLSSIPWDMINYVLNHKQGTKDDIQNALYYFIYGISPSTPATQAMVNDALANGSGFVPAPGEIVAVILYPVYPDPLYSTPQDMQQISIIEVTKPPEEKFPKQFTSSYGFGGFAAPSILDEGLNTTVMGLHSGPRVSWNVTYYFANTAEFLGSQYDGEAHYFRLWDKWGGNLMALKSTPTAFNPVSNIVTLADGSTFEINYAGYAAYVGSGLMFTDSRGRPATITLHTGDQQQGTNPGKGKGTQKDGASYDVDLVWDIGYLEPGQSSTLTIVIAPGKNPGGVLMFSSPGFEWINTGPRARVYGDAAFTDFLYAIDKTIQLGVLVEK